MPWYSSTHANDKRRFNKGRFLKKGINLGELKTLYLEGRKNKELAAFFNCSIPTIRRRIRILIPDNLRMRKERTSQYNPINQKIINLYVNHHYSTIKIAAITNLSVETIRGRLHSLGIKVRGKNFKNLQSFHPGKLNRVRQKEYAVSDLKEFNQKLLDYHCLMYSNARIAELLQVDRGTVKRRISHLTSMHHFKTRFCKKCGNLYRFMPTQYQRNCKICLRCRKDVS